MLLVLLTAIRFAVPENLLDGPNLGKIAERRAGCVGVDVVHFVSINSGICKG